MKFLPPLSRCREGILQVLVTFLLAGCSAQELAEWERQQDWPVANWSAVRQQQQPYVRRLSFRHDVIFGPGRADLNPQSAQEFQLFIDRIGSRSGDQITILGPNSAGTAGNLSLIERRLAAIRDYFLHRVELRMALADSPAALPSIDVVAVIVSREAIILPPCPNWTEFPNANFENQPTSNWSCATAVNLGLMVNDPNDLVRGRDSGIAEAEYLSRSIDNYRKGKTKPLLNDVSTAETYSSSSPIGQ